MKHEHPRAKGRPLAFEIDAVLDAAVLVFWSKGYEGASLDALTRAMGINRPSLYAKFGSKHGLFMAALDRYTETISRSQVIPLAEEPDIRRAISGYYRAIIACVASDDRPAGCLIASVATELALRDEAVRAKVTDLLQQAELFIAARLTDASYGQGQSARPPPDVAAKMVVAVGQSLASRARLGASPAELGAVADGFVQQMFDEVQTDDHPRLQIH